MVLASNVGVGAVCPGSASRRFRLTSVANSRASSAHFFRAFFARFVGAVRAFSVRFKLARLLRELFFGDERHRLEIGARSTNSQI